ncbi:MAG: rubredoxin [Rhodoferax sp.]|nr:rubredoxin [Rhodoferax sp.]
MCVICGLCRAAQAGDPAAGLAPRTPWNEVPDDGFCPGRGMAENDIEVVQA